MAEPEEGPDGSPAPARMAQAVAPEFSLGASIGGVRGLLEAVLPVTVFSLVYGVTQDLRVSVVAALVPAAVLAAWRVVQREPLTQALSGLVAIGLGAYLAHRSGRAQDYFLPTIWKNVAFLAVYLVSALVRWPVVGLVLAPVLGENLAWRADPARRRAYTQVTLIWAAMFALRLAVQVPLFLAGKVSVLGAANVPLGLPLFALVVWLSWLVLRRVPVTRTETTTPLDQPAGQPAE